MICSLGLCGWYCWRIHFTYRRLVSSIQRMPTIRQWWSYPRNLYGAWMPTLGHADEFHYRREHLRWIYNCTACSNHSRWRWILQVCIEWQSTCIDHRTLDWSMYVHMSTIHKLYLYGGTYGLGKDQHKLACLMVCIYLLHKVYSLQGALFFTQGSLSHHP